MQNTTKTNRKINKKTDTAKRGNRIWPFLAAFLAAAGFLLYQAHKFYYRKSAGEIGERFEMMEAFAYDKRQEFAGTPLALYYIYGRTLDGHVQSYRVNKVTYEAIALGDLFPVYRFGDSYHTQAGGVIERHAWKQLKSGAWKNHRA